MPQEPTTTLLVVSRHNEPPEPPAIMRAVAAAGLGALDYAPAAPTDTQAGRGRSRLGTFTATLPEGIAGSARIVVARYDDAVTHGMGEAAFNALARGLEAEDARTLREGALALELRLTTPEREAQQPLDWALRVVRILLDLTKGVVIDPMAQRSLGRAQLATFGIGDLLVHVAFHDEAWSAESRWLHTHGLQKFARPELDLVDVPLSLMGEATDFLRDLAANLCAGATLSAGGLVDMDELGMLVAASAPIDVDHQAAYGRLRLADEPLPGEREPDNCVRFLKRTALAEAHRYVGMNDMAGASSVVERILAADPDDSATLDLKAHLCLRLGQITDALDIGELMELRLPDDYHGPLVVGKALATLGRYREALRALERAIEREPEAAEAFAVRADVRERLGQEQLAAVDRAHADYLRS